MAKPIDKKKVQQTAAPKRNVPAVSKKTTEMTADKMPAHLAKMMAEDAGKGVSTAQEDNLVPILSVLQKLSPQCEKRDQKYMEGAEAGKIWLKNAAEPFVDGEEGVPFQPCWFDKDWVEWVPRESGGGFVARHRAVPKEAKTMKDPKNPKKTITVMPNGNHIVETRYHIGRIFLENGDRLPYVIPLSSSGHSVSKEWMFRMNNAKTPDGEKAPAFAKLYLLRTRSRSNTQGAWFVLDPQELGWVASTEDYEAGRDLYNAFDTGEQQVDTRTMERGAGGEEPDDRSADDMD